MSVGMLADFCIRMAGGLAALVLLTPWRKVPLPFFRNQCLVVLGVSVVAALDLARLGSGLLVPGLAIGAAASAYLASVAWGLGLPRVAIPLVSLVVGLDCALAVWSTPGPPGALWALQLAGRLASGMLLGSAVTAMLLGHHYLTAPAMSIDRLRNLVGVLAGCLLARAALAGAGVALVWSHWAALGTPQHIDGLLLGARWVVGIFGAALATLLAWRTVAIHSTQSATGILFVATIFVLFGETTALALGRHGGSIF
jgi:hypothetical protein